MAVVFVGADEALADDGGDGFNNGDVDSLLVGDGSDGMVMVVGTERECGQKQKHKPKAAKSLKKQKAKKGQI
mgnify:CR=1 FL=1